MRNFLDRLEGEYMQEFIYNVKELVHWSGASGSVESIALPAGLLFFIRRNGLFVVGEDRNGETISIIGPEDSAARERFLDLLEKAEGQERPLVPITLFSFPKSVVESVFFGEDIRPDISRTRLKKIAKFKGYIIPVDAPDNVFAAALRLIDTAMTGNDSFRCSAVLSYIFTAMAAVRGWNDEQCMSAFALIASYSQGTSLSVQPDELTTLAVKLSGYHGGKVYNPFAGLGSYGIEMKAGKDYFAEELDPLVQSLGVVRMNMAGADCPDYVSGNSLVWREGSYDCIITTPPFGMCVDNGELSPHGESLESWVIGKAVASLADGGTFCGVFPAAVLFRNNMDALRRTIVDDNLLETVVKLPGGIFQTTGVQTCIIVLRKGRTSDKVRFIDATSFREKLKLRTLLDIDDLIEDIEGEGRYVYTVSTDEVKSKYYELGPEQYAPMSIKYPTPSTPVEFGAVSMQYKGGRIAPNQVGRVIRVKDLSADPFDCYMDIDSLDEEIVEQRFVSVTVPVLLISKVNNLKPTFCEASREKPVYIASDVAAYAIDETVLYVPYLAYMISQQSDRVAKGAVIPHITLDSIQHLRIMLTGLQEQKRFMEDIQMQHKLELARQMGIEEVVEAMKARYIDEVRMRKHDMRPHLQQLRYATKLIENYGHTISEDGTVPEKLARQIERQKRAIDALTALVDALSEESVFGTPERLDIISVLSSLKPSEDCYGISLSVDDTALREAIEDWQPGDPVCVEIARIDFEKLVFSILENALRHGFTDRSRNDYMMYINVSVDAEYKKVTVEFSNNGTPFPEGLTVQRYGMKGEKAGETGNTGVGGFRVREVVEHYGGELSLFTRRQNDEELPTVCVSFNISK